MEIRKATTQDFDRIMEIYASARRFMAEHGNPNQWGPTHWPPEDQIHRDIDRGDLYVCTQEGRIAAVFYYICGQDIEPTYAVIEDGQWLDPGPYGVVHRIASDGCKLIWFIHIPNGVNLTKSTENSVVKPNIRSGPHCSHCSVYKCYFRMISPIDREFISIT